MKVLYISQQPIMKLFFLINVLFEKCQIKWTIFTESIYLIKILIYKRQVINWVCFCFYYTKQFDFLQLSSFNFSISMHKSTTCFQPHSFVEKFSFFSRMLDSKWKSEGNEDIFLFFQTVFRKAWEFSLSFVFFSFSPFFVSALPEGC